MAVEPKEALVNAMYHLRMTLAGFASYSGTPSKIDEGWAELVAERLAVFGIVVTKKE